MMDCVIQYDNAIPITIVSVPVMLEKAPNESKLHIRTVIAQKLVCWIVLNGDNSCYNVTVNAFICSFVPCSKQYI